jgi:SAM-dependent methyltransferase
MTSGTNWEERYEHGDTPWDKGAPHPALVDYLERTPLEGRVLAVGCGLGHDVRALAAAGARVTGIDIAPFAIRAAESVPKIADEQYLLADLFALPAELRNRFDWVWEHTCFCAIDPSARAAYLRGVLEALTPEGRLLAVFYLDPGVDSGPPFGVEITELDALFGDDFRLIEEWTPARTYPEREGRERMRLLQRKPRPA